MYGVETSSLSSTIAKCWRLSARVGRRERVVRAALGDARVIVLERLAALVVKSNVTIGWLPACWSKFCSGFLMSVPDSAGLSRMTQ